MANPVVIPEYLENHADMDDAPNENYLGTEEHLVQIVKRRPLSPINPDSFADQVRQRIAENRSEERAVVDVNLQGQTVAEIYRPPLPETQFNGTDVIFEFTSLMRVYEVDDATQLFDIGPDFPYLTRSDQIQAALIRLNRAHGRPTPLRSMVPIQSAVISLVENVRGDSNSASQQMLALIMRQNEVLRGPEGAAHPHWFPENVERIVEQALADAQQLRTASQPPFPEMPPLPRRRWSTRLIPGFDQHVARIRGWVNRPHIAFGTRYEPGTEKSIEQRKTPKKKAPQVRVDEHGKPRREVFVYQMTSMYPYYPMLHISTGYEFFERTME